MWYLAIQREYLLRLILIIWISAVTVQVAKAQADASPSAEPTRSDTEESSSMGPSNAVEGEEREAAPDPRALINDRVMVVGTPEAVRGIPGSAHFIDSIELQKYEYNDLHRVLRQVPGVNIQEEDGYGLRPNIGLRGTGVERSSKITLMEDGVLIAPAPYAAPSAYYSPTQGRMEGVEVRKGSAAIKQGPFSNGGAINLISTSIPAGNDGKLRFAFGEDRTLQLHGNYGASTERFGFLVETYQMETDGFKDLDGGGATGFDVEDYVGKLRWSGQQESGLRQELTLKVSRTDQLGDETYLGLTQQDFDTTPRRRYLASSVDNISTDHEQFQLRHFLRPTKNLDITTTIYRNDFFRNWFKNESTNGVRNGTVLDDPLTYALELAYLRGDVDTPDDVFRLRNNRRDYYSEGIQSVAVMNFDAGRTHHDFEIGVRWHQDEEDRIQEEDRYGIRDGRMRLTSVGASGSQANRVATAEAVAVYVQDEIRFGKWTLTPGVRFESIDTERLDYSRTDPERLEAPGQRQNSVDQVVPGLGVSFGLNNRWTLFGGVHRGFAPPSPSSRESVEPEESTNYEFGARFNAGRLSIDTVAFFNDYDNLLGADTASGGGEGTGDQFNGGAVEVQGLEASLATTLAGGAGFSLPLRASYTYASSEFRSSFTTSFADWSPEVRIGDELPYSPEHQLFVELGLVRGVWSAFLGASYVGETRTKAGQGPIALAERIEDHLTADLSADVKLRDRYKLYVQVRNVFDETYVAARRPYGLRPGLPRTALLGLTIDF